ncbi:hypothetical protein GE253_01015 [Niveispirillum sp. SYP-B3756]|uniref:aspartyl/asparaginyl beta-hydroxylase domain-containing protein n=1 Tax=Niveispirillum sp. SYP-B3756 TaxID=2662178 RepID=UPI001291DA8A|nr:aspartyl/asparaginyl beta-hydroxylase domain-containing protein [Niveispirillum sp. SYP-B3756]MQP63916.1 hypothetical protein [Niveispirillum sp. SYP-B3756]
MAELLPWQFLTVESGLLLAAASSIRLDAAELHRQTMAAIAATPPEARNRYGSEDGDWTAIPLLQNPGAYGDNKRLLRMPALDHLPLLETAVLSLPGLQVEGCHIIRQPAGGYLRWHYDNQALHLSFARLLLAVQVPDEAFTWIGHERLAFPAGTLWTGDFSQPHQVENPSDLDRLVIAVDVSTNDMVRSLFPPALYADAAGRQYRAQEGINALLAARNS